MKIYTLPKLRDMTERHPEADKGYTPTQEYEMDIKRAAWIENRAADLRRGADDEKLGAVEVFLGEEYLFRRFLQEIECAHELKPLDCANACLMAVKELRKMQTSKALLLAMEEAEEMQDWEFGE
jgi:hypothetical protein